MIWFTADTHYAHANIIKYCNRPENHDELLIENYNSLVGKKDTVYHLGDFAFKNPEEYLKKLNGIIYLIRGNHDSNKTIRTFGDRFLGHRYYLRFNKQLSVLDHYAPRVWCKSHHGSWALYGHSHGDIEDWGKSMDVGVDCWDYKPVSYDQVKEIMDKKNIKKVDHHV